MFIFFFFFFKQKTAYDMRISDWSSDVCSSDLAGRESDAILLILAERLDDREQPGRLVGDVEEGAIDARRDRDEIHRPQLKAVLPLVAPHDLVPPVDDEEILDRGIVRMQRRGVEIGRAHV